MILTSFFILKKRLTVLLLRMHNKILILDFGSQYTQLIARRIRELEVYCEVVPFHFDGPVGPEVKGVIFSGSPRSVRETELLSPKKDWLSIHLPVLGICYGAQFLAQSLGGEVLPSSVREYGRASLEVIAENPLLQGVAMASQVWMSHSDTISRLPQDFTSIARTETIPIAAFAHSENPVFGVQFHPEVVHTEEGLQILKNFVFSICGCTADWTPGNFIQETVKKIQEETGNSQVILGLSGGVDSSVAALLLHEAIGTRLHCIFVDNGLLRKNEYRDVLHSYRNMGLQVRGVDASGRFYAGLDGISDPEKKRKTIGRIFIEVFEEEAHSIQDVDFLGQGTIYPDVIESVSVHGPSVTIKSHHNVGGLPEQMKLKVIEPLKSLFKDEVRRVGAALGLEPAILNRHPFPGPGLAIRILGDITPAKVALLQEADSIFISALHEFGYYGRVWQAGAILLPVQSVGVMGDERTYEQVVCLRAVSSTDGMTADWIDFPHAVLAEISNRIINRVKGINRVVYDISSKPPATIEWE
jgi:GMP synthase (glutamine-hydrolysing)